MENTFVPRDCFFQMLYDYVHSHLQPWFEADVQAIIDEPGVTTLRGEKYASMHIRRTDKDLEVEHTETEVPVDLESEIFDAMQLLR